MTEAVERDVKTFPSSSPDMRPCSGGGKGVMEHSPAVGTPLIIIPSLARYSAGAKTSSSSSSECLKTIDYSDRISLAL